MSGSVVPPKPERPSEVGEPAASPAEGTETLAAWRIVSIFFYSSRTRSETLELNLFHASWSYMEFTLSEFCEQM
jgi:hypothetical protein